MNATINPALLNTIKLYQPQLAILFGSQARRDANPDSDVDLVLVKDTQDNFFDRLKKFALMLPKNMPRVDAFIYTPEEFERMKEWESPIVMQALQEGKVIYEASA